MHKQEEKCEREININQFGNPLHLMHAENINKICITGKKLNDEITIKVSNIFVGFVYCVSFSYQQRNRGLLRRKSLKIFGYCTRIKSFSYSL